LYAGIEVLRTRDLHEQAAMILEKYRQKYAHYRSFQQSLNLVANC